MDDINQLEIKPFTIHNGLAVYQLGDGPPILLFPYPHASTMRPMAKGKLAMLLAELGRRVITFDPPRLFRSTRPMQGDMAEMLGCATESLELCDVAGPVNVVGHSMGGLCAIGFTLEHPELVRRLVLVASLSGWPAAFRWSVPHNWSPWRDRAWWQCMGLGFRQMVGLGNLAVHTRLDNLVKQASFVNDSYIELWEIEPGDEHRPPPPRSKWLNTVRQVDYKIRLSEIRASTLVLVGRYDPQTPLPCSQELQAGILDSRLVMFEHSGHSPFIEESQRFTETVGRFLLQARGSPGNLGSHDH